MSSTWTPFIVGGGLLALPSGGAPSLDLVDERRFASGVVYLRYRLASQATTTQLAAVARRSRQPRHLAEPSARRPGIDTPSSLSPAQQQDGHTGHRGSFGSRGAPSGTR